MAITNVVFVRFGNIELAHDEILAMAEEVSEEGRDIIDKYKKIG